MNRQRPSALLKIFFRIPLFLHKLGFVGWERIIGAQWMLITTIGRKSGKRRQAMVDILLHDGQTDTYYILSAYGSSADWVRNIQTNPRFEAQVGRRKFTARATTLSEESAGEMLVQFHRRKPAYTRAVMNAAGMKFKNEDDLRRLGGRLLLLSVTPQVKDADHSST
jgi:deazaflavin-dependent oxidoreductase (nitroreductase family)